MVTYSTLGDLEKIERNARLYPWYIAVFNAFFWMPVFFLYFGENLGLARVLQLEGIYYAAVVVLEVPSGYISDRFGRKTTLLGASLMLVVAYLIFFFASSFSAFAAAQVVLAAGIALNSGTDTSFHYDSLTALGREVEYAQREAVAARSAMLATSLSALIGGGVAAIDLRYAYGLSVIAAVAGLITVLSFTEPQSKTAAQAAPFFSQLHDCFRHLRQPRLAWLFGFVVLITILEHIPYEFYQPYLDLLGAQLDFSPKTALIAGVHMAIATLIGALFAHNSARIAGRLGIAKTLLLAALLQLIIISVMGLFLNEVIVALILLREIAGGMTRAPINAAITPYIPQKQRATFLSIQSLAGRVGFSALLVGLSFSTGNIDTHTWSALSHLLLICAGLGARGLGVLAISLWWVDVE
ncbi:MFS transporter [Bradymonas sediminis]|uniref:Uncharacterized protein n=1 Tax=Bradymonas sediminis TaxID=1548548 RepID=A0A2Z4FIV6_9DELT|nr:MFS transporter [Bradymonas sediminis]AWV88674.1 hypothetical protein DN745_04700 [Bradymonas sediminis]TDP63640.1 MFS transporter [Bradymonas sediminis]